MLSPSEKLDKAIRATDLDALACRFSANQIDYLIPKDPYIELLISSYKTNLQFCSGYTSLSAGRTIRSVFGEKKLPIINRGTYLRTKSIDIITEEFIKEFGRCQIVSLGGGSDSRGFKILKKFDDVIYHEIDFPESTKIKRLAILANEDLREVVGTNEQRIDVNSKDQFQNIPSNLDTEKYHLKGFDLRILSDSVSKTCTESLLTHFDKTLPTLVLSECVLCYTSPSENEAIIKFYKGLCKSFLSILIYEPMSLNDSFGLTMAKNLSQRGIDLKTFDEMPDLRSRFEFLKEKCDLRHIKLTSMKDVGGYFKASGESRPWIDDDDMKRIDKLELIDEVEEIQLLFEHYCLCYAETGRPDTKFRFVDNLRWESNFWYQEI